MLQISLSELKNTLGGQLGNLLSKGLAQQSSSDTQMSTDSRVSTQSLPERTQYRGEDSYGRPRAYQDSSIPRGYRDDNSNQSYTANDRQHASDRRRYDNEDTAYGSRNSAGATDRYTPETQRKPLFPIPSSSAEKPKSILKRSILKKTEPEPAQRKPANGKFYLRLLYF